MQLEMACPSCPLCKIKLPASLTGFAPSTRLCEPCQALVLTAFRGADLAAVSPLSVVAQNGGIVQVERDSPALDYALAASGSFSAQMPAGGSGLERDEQHPALFEAHDSSGFTFFEDEEPNHRFEAEEGDSSPVAETGSSELADPSSSSALAQATSIAETDLAHEYVEAATPLPNEHVFAGSTPDPESIEENVFEDGQRQEELSIGDHEVADPWEAPLPAWEYSHNEWPVLVGPTERRSLVTPQRALAAAVILLAVSAGLYFLVFRTSSPPRRTAANAATTERASEGDAGHASASEPENSDSLNAAASTVAAALNAKPADAVVQEATPSNEKNNAQGRFSLQAAAFPTHAGADEFAEKLKRAGVPSYVAPVDLARRGKWFRVRVGRFNAAEEAQKFAGEAQQRARAAGLSLQLIVCQYDQP